MATLKARAEALGRTELELKSEMAAALGRIGNTLSELIATLHEMRRELTRLPEIELAERLNKYNEIHAKARLYFW
jgi:hypothetical protein